MASTEPAPLTLLRVKRARTNEALDALHVLPKRPRRDGIRYSPDQSLRFRRLPAAADLAALGPKRVIDVDPCLLRTTVRDDSPADSDSSDTRILYNGSPMQRELVAHDDVEMFDFFGERDNPRLEHLLGDEAPSEDGDENIAWVHADNIPIFAEDSSDDDLLSDSDGRSIDYPSTPEGSVECASEDEWRRQEQRILQADRAWREDGNSSDDGENWGIWGDDYGSEQDGDDFDYEA